LKKNKKLIVKENPKREMNKAPANKWGDLVHSRTETIPNLNGPISNLGDFKADVFDLKNLKEEFLSKQGTEDLKSAYDNTITDLAEARKNDIEKTEHNIFFAKNELEDSLDQISTFCVSFNMKKNEILRSKLESGWEIHNDKEIYDSDCMSVYTESDLPLLIATWVPQFLSTEEYSAIDDYHQYIVIICISGVEIELSIYQNNVVTSKKFEIEKRKEQNSWSKDDEELLLFNIEKKNKMKLTPVYHDPTVTGLAKTFERLVEIKTKIAEDEEKNEIKKEKTKVKSILIKNRQAFVMKMGVGYNVEINVSDLVDDDNVFFVLSDSRVLF